MKRFLLFLALTVLLAACFVLVAGAEEGKATFYHNDTAVANASRGPDGSVTLAAAPDTGTRCFIGWVITGTDGKGSLHAAGSVYNGAAGDLRFDALAVELYTLGGAAVSCNAPHSLRFDGAIPLSDYDRLASLVGTQNISLGMLIAPYKTSKGNAFERQTAPEGTKDCSTASFLYSAEGWGVFAGTREIADSELLEKYCARAYLSVKIGNTTVTVHGNYDKDKHIRTAHGVTAAAFTDRQSGTDAVYLHQTDAGCYSRYTAQQLTALRARLDKVIYVSIMDEGSVQSKYSRDNYDFYSFDCVDAEGNTIHNLYTSPYKVERVLTGEPAGFDTYVITGVNGADFHTVSAYFIGGSYRAPDPSEWREDGIYISVRQIQS